ncbi:MAG: hypothetical protein AB7D51_14865, partial [Desulfovibrionaceae bacterium]
PGSLRARFADILDSIPDRSIKELNYKEIIGHFLFSARPVVVNWLRKNKSLSNPDQIKELNIELQEIAEYTSADNIPEYRPITSIHVLRLSTQASKALEHLDDNEKISIAQSSKKYDFPNNITVEETAVDFKSTVEHSPRVELLVKKPDFIGKSKWCFKIGQKAEDVSITDTQWLYDFQQRRVIIQPGDSLVADMITKTTFDQNNMITRVEYEIIKVHSVRPYNDQYLRLPI